MNDSPPRVRVLIGRPGGPSGVMTRVVTQEERSYWVELGWEFVCEDPDDELAYVYWMDVNGKRE